jgi:phosphatidylglycerol:prolipoprotein diacylglycerol transferase
MCSELIRIPYEWGGVPIFGFGVLLAIWAVAGAALLAALVRHQGWSADTWSYLPALLLLGGAIVALPRLFPGGLPIRGYGLMVVLGAAAGIVLAVRRARQVGLDHELILSLAFWMFVCGIVAARLFYVIEYWQEDFAGKSLRDTVLAVLNFPSGGLVVYGALAGASLAFILFARRHKLPMLATADLVAPSLAIGLAFGRIGCFLNGCCYGGPTDWPWAVTFPQFSSRYEAVKSTQESPRFSPPYGRQVATGDMHGFRWEGRNGRIVVTKVQANSPASAAGLADQDAIIAANGNPIASSQDLADAVIGAFLGRDALQFTLSTGRRVTIGPAPIPARSRPVHPTQIYAAINAALIAWLVWSFYPLRRRDGEAIALLFTVYPVTRFLLEIIRTDEPAVFGTGLSISQNISVLVFVAAIGMWWYLARQPRTVLHWPTS